ncbi:MAG: energy-coupling factor transporter transmembrane protein EcfT [Anaerolineae bacterium]|nr:energy-coupling factor transporter transmembrane protein EcfT [Anaerolineae bacterium]
MYRSIGLYQPGDSFLHGLHPKTKLFMSLTGLILIFAGPGDGLSAAISGLFAMMILWRAGLARLAFKQMRRLLLFFGLILVLIHALFNPENRNILFEFGPFSVGLEGLIFAALIWLRLAAALMVSLVLVSSTHPAQLVQALAESGLPYQLAYLIGSPLLLLPQVLDKIKSIRAAQQSRGLEVQGNFFIRARALFPLAAPLIFSTLVDVEERSLALEFRGFNAPFIKTSLKPLADSLTQIWIRRGCLMINIGVILSGVWWRINGIY